MIAPIDFTKQDDRVVPLYFLPPKVGEIVRHSEQPIYAKITAVRTLDGDPNLTRIQIREIKANREIRTAPYVVSWQEWMVVRPYSSFTKKAQQALDFIAVSEELMVQVLKSVNLRWVDVYEGSEIVNREISYPSRDKE